MVEAITREGASDRNVGEGSDHERACEETVATRIRYARVKEEMRRRRREEARGAGGRGTVTRREKQVAAKWSTRVGMRLWWWIEKAKGAGKGRRRKRTDECGRGSGTRATPTDTPGGGDAGEAP